MKNKERYEKLVEEAIENVGKPTTIIIPPSLDGLKYLPKKYVEKVYPQYKKREKDKL